MVIDTASSCSANRHPPVVGGVVAGRIVVPAVVVGRIGALDDFQLFLIQTGKESQDVCFLAQQDLTSFLREQGVKSAKGEIATKDGRVLGSHQGIWKYTVGQRRGLGIPDATPWYVVGLCPESNRVIVGKNDTLFQKELTLSDMQWHLNPPIPWQGKVQLRSRHKAAEAEVSPAENGLKNGNWRVRFQEPQRAVTPGQFAVLYQDNMVVGSGVIIS